MLEEDGYAILEGVFDASEVAAMVGHAEASLEAGAGDRNALSWPWVQEIAQDPRIIRLVGDRKPVRAILRDMKFARSPHFLRSFHTIRRHRPGH